MKYGKILPLLILSLTLPCLTGCSGSIYANYRDLEQIQLIQTLGVDRTGPGSLRLSISSGADVGGHEPILLSIREASIATAMERLQEYSARETLYFAHTQFLLLGEETAKRGVAEYLDYVQRNPQMRTDVELFLVRGSTAETMITGSGDGKYDASDELHALLRDLERQKGTEVFSCTEVSRRLAESGAALIHAIVPASSEGVKFPSSGGLFILSAGYGVLRDGALIGYILGDAAKGVALLRGTLTGGSVTVSVGGEYVTLKVNGCGIKLRPQFAEDGSLRAVEVQAELDAAIAELENPELSAQPDFTAAVTQALSRRSENWIRSVLQFSAAQRADFLALGQQLRRLDTQRFDSMPERWEDVLPELEFEVSVTSSVEHSYDNFGPVNTEGEGMGGAA